MRNNHLTLAASRYSHQVAVLVVFSISATSLVGAEFFGLAVSELPMFTKLNGNLALSDDGSTIGGAYLSESENSTFPFLWQPHTGFQALEGTGFVQSISDDGTVVSGIDLSNFREPHFYDVSMFVASNGTRHDFGVIRNWAHFPGANVTRDGNKVLFISGRRNSVYEWTFEGALKEISLPTAASNISIESSSDGSMFAYRDNDSPDGETYIWTEADGFKTTTEVTGVPLRMQTTGPTGASRPSSLFENGFVGTHENGTVYRWDARSNTLQEIIATVEPSFSLITSRLGNIIGLKDHTNEHFGIWNANDGLIFEDFPRGFDVLGGPRSLSSSGNAVSFRSRRDVDNKNENLVWTATTGIVTVGDYLSQFGLDSAIEGWDLSASPGHWAQLYFSDDASIIAARGTDPDGEAAIWVAYVDDAALGDFNRDGVIDAADIDQLTTATVMNPNFEYFDLDDSGVADATDRVIWVTDIKDTYFGDANLDGEFNSGDLVNIFMAGEYEDGIESNSTWATGDWNGDGEFGTGDLVAAFEQGGYEQGPRAATQAVPEPSSLLLIAFSAGLIGRSRTRRAKRHYHENDVSN